jgi:hypothetical protein
VEKRREVMHSNWGMHPDTLEVMRHRQPMREGQHVAVKLSDLERIIADTRSLRSTRERLRFMQRCIPRRGGRVKPSNDQVEDRSGVSYMHEVAEVVARAPARDVRRLSRSPAAQPPPGDR